jgi:hypothetical protein
MENIPVFDEEAMDRISKAVRDVEDMKAGFPNLVRALLPDLFDDSVTINVIEVTDDLAESPGHWPGIVHNLENPWNGSASPIWKALKFDGSTTPSKLDHKILVIPIPDLDAGTGKPVAGTLSAGVYIGVLWGVTEVVTGEEDEPWGMEVYLAIGLVAAATGGGGIVIRAAAAGAGPVNAYEQIADGTGALFDTGPIIQVRKFPQPAREDFELNGRYPAFKVGTQYFAETGPATACEEVVTKDSVGHLDCSSMTITFTGTKKVRFINRACP